MKEPARLIIPAWGEAYVRKLVSVTLPAILAPGNLPALNEQFDVELVIVTETRLFDQVGGSRAFQRAQQLGAGRLVSLDDLLIDDPIDYGAVLTYALFRGFADLGPAMTETYLIFLNADFIVSDGSLGHIGTLMREGRRVIHAPSFRVALEDVWPQLCALVDQSGMLRLAPRDMVRLALTNKHRTVKARTVNQRLCHQAWMDQYYWYVDEETLIGYQLPIALVAIKAERVVAEPVLVWDYGFIPEACPTAEPYFIADSDHFFMMEPQSRESGRSMIRVGWISIAEITRGVSLYTTKEQRNCGRQLLTIHAGDLPPDLDDAIRQSRAYMAEIDARLSPPQPHNRGHPLLGQWFAQTEERRRGARLALPSDREPALTKPAPHDRSFARLALQLTQHTYRNIFGSPPQVGKFHPLWADCSPVAARMAAWRKAGEQKILWVSSSDSILNRLVNCRVTPAAFLTAQRHDSSSARECYDACICELALNELSNLDQLYNEIRARLKDGGHIAVNVVKTGNLLDGAETLLEKTIFPSVDISEIHFFGTAMTGVLRLLYMRLSHSLRKRPIARALALSAILVLLAPIVRLANARAAQRDNTIFSPTWTSLVIDFTVKRVPPPKAVP